MMAMPMKKGMRRLRLAPKAELMVEASAMLIVAYSSARHPGIEARLHDVGGEKDEADQDGQRERQALDDRIIAAIDRIDHQPADAGNGEDRFGDHGAADEGSDIEPE